MTLRARIQALLDESAATENLDTGVALELLREAVDVLADPGLADKMTELLHGYTLVLEIKPADGTFVDAVEGHIEFSEGDALVCLDLCGGTDESPVSERFFNLTLDDVIDEAYARHPLVAPASTS
jgi:hypothetical protein